MSRSMMIASATSEHRPMITITGPPLTTNPQRLCTPGSPARFAGFATVPVGGAAPVGAWARNINGHIVSDIMETLL
jgi:hypothetical protein